MRMLIFGGRGYIGERFLTLYPDASYPAADIADEGAVAEILDREQPEILINCAGKTGRPNIDWCETHREETLRANVQGPLQLLQECGKRGIYWVHLSSGCIYEGDNGGKGFSEEDPPNFSGSFYSRTKAWSDRILSEFPLLILRLRMPFDGSRSERSLLMKLQKYSRVLDVPNSVTSLPDFLAASENLILRRATGIYNVVNEGAVSPYEIMEMYRAIVDPSHAFERLTHDALPDVVSAGRSNCVLSIEKLKREGITMRPVQDALREALEQLRAAHG